MNGFVALYSIILIYIHAISETIMFSNYIYHFFFLHTCDMLKTEIMKLQKTTEK